MSGSQDDDPLVPCATPGCKFFGALKSRQGWCSSCYVDPGHELWLAGEAARQRARGFAPESGPLLWRACIEANVAECKRLWEHYGARLDLDYSEKAGNLLLVHVVRKFANNPNIVGKVVKFLVGKGASVQNRDVTLILRHCLLSPHDHRALLRYLLDRGVDPLARASDGKSTLDWLGEEIPCRRKNLVERGRLLQKNAPLFGRHAKRSLQLLQDIVDYQQDALLMFQDNARARMTRFYSLIFCLEQMQPVFVAELVRLLFFPSLPWIISVDIKLQDRRYRLTREDAQPILGSCEELDNSRSSSKSSRGQARSGDGKKRRAETEPAGSASASSVVSKPNKKARHGD